MMGILRRLRLDPRGTSTIELAMVVPLMTLFVAGATDIAYGVAAKSRLQAAASRSLELATSGGLNSAAFQTLNTEAANAAGVPTSNVTVTKWRECGGTLQLTFEGTCTVGQEVARFVRVRVTGSYRPMFAAVAPGWQTNANGDVGLSGSATVRVQ